ncbi:hypothetical protein MMC10_004445 [Thelotrema lepadinum]|nr:hypothetical protein [Thelotrema lepadinum]
MLNRIWTSFGSLEYWSLLQILVFLYMVVSPSRVVAFDNCSNAQKTQKRSQEVASYLGANFVRMWLHGCKRSILLRHRRGICAYTETAVVVGDTLYIDGGEVNFNTSNGLNGDTASTFRVALRFARSIVTLIVNDTLAIGLSKSWEPANIQINVATKPSGVPILNCESLWPGPDGASFYSFGGDPSNSIGDPVQEVPVDLWQFNTQTWNQVQGQKGLPQVRPAGGSSASSVGSGYILGGFQGNDFDSQGDLWPMPGLVSYNMTSNSWSNSSSAAISEFGTVINGGLHFVPNFGPEGILIAVGGESTGAIDSPWIEDGQRLAPFTNISIYDVITDTWYWQTATGATGPDEIPPNGTMFCMTGVQSSQGTYEILVYGGHNDNLFDAGSTVPSENEQNVQAIFNAVYVLSLPGFVWFKGNDTSAEPRTGHTCEVIGSRQMISIGGINPVLGLDGGLGNTDPWPQGLGIFDMVELEWVNAYNATAAAYVVPLAVQNWYNEP